MSQDAGPTTAYDTEPMEWHDSGPMTVYAESGTGATTYEVRPMTAYADRAPHLEAEPMSAYAEDLEGSAEADPFLDPPAAPSDHPPLYRIAPEEGYSPDFDRHFWATADRPTRSQALWSGFCRLMKLAGLAH